jgi:hypothetical protein
MPYCPYCGKPIPAGSNTCPSCHPGQKKGGETKKDGDVLVWTAKMPVITSPVVVKQLLLALGGASLFLAVLMVLLGAYPALPVIFALFLFFAALLLLIAAAIQFFTKGGPLGEFAITPEGVGYRAGKESRAINRATLVGTALGGSLPGVGGSLINISREMDFMNWKEMRSIRSSTSDRSLVFYRKILVFPLVLYCTEENYDQALALVRKYAPPGILKIKKW